MTFDTNSGENVMADLADVTAYLASAVSAVVYPNGTSSPSIAPVPVGYTNPMDVRIYEGWPIAEQIDADVSGQVLKKNPDGTTSLAPRANGPAANVSIFPLVGTSVNTFQIEDNTYTITPAQINLVVTASGTPGAGNTQLTITGTPAAGEFVSIEADRQFSYSRGGASAAAILAALLADVQVNYPSATVVGSTLAIPTIDFGFVVRQGGVGVLGKVTHRQCHAIMVTVWAPDHNTRSVLAGAIDNVLKQTLVVAMPDTSQARVVYQRTTVSDEAQNFTIYRRDLIYEVEYSTVQEFPGVTITSVTVTISAQEYNNPVAPPNVTYIS